MKFVRETVDTLGELALLYAGLLIGSAAVFSLVESKSFFDALYWAGTTATSTGYGDISPQTVSGKILAFILQHVSIFVVAPLVIVRLHERMVENRDAFTHHEQEEIKAGIGRVEQMLKEIQEDNR